MIKPTAKLSDLLSAVNKEPPDSLSGTGTQSLDLSETILSTTDREMVAEEAKDRGKILQRLDYPPIITAIAQSKNQKLFFFEEVFRSANKLIVDVVCKEFVFVLEFFDLTMTQVSPVFIQIFSRVVNKYIEWLT